MCNSDNSARGCEEEDGEYETVPSGVERDRGRTDGLGPQDSWQEGPRSVSFSRTREMTVSTMTASSSIGVRSATPDRVPSGSSQGSLPASSTGGVRGSGTGSDVENDSID